MIKHCFFTKECKIDRQLADHADLERCLKDKSWDFKAINFVNQIHSDKVYVIDSKSKIQGKQNLVKADAIVTNQKELVIAVVTADCAPIILKDEKNEVTAAVHAGWRGAKSGIIKNAIDAMTDLGSQIENIEAFIGPMIHQDSYQVSQEFYDDFLGEDKYYARFFKKDQEAGKFLFDLVGFVEASLVECGVKKIKNAKIDTYKSQNHASYRRSCHQGEDFVGRNVSVVML